MGGLSDTDKRVLSFFGIIMLSSITTIPVLIMTGNRLISLFAWILLSGCFLWYGRQMNKEYEVSIGSILGTLVNWVIPPGLSWWFPFIGKGVQHRSTQVENMDLSKDNSLKDVKTRDGGTVEIGVSVTWRIIDLYKVAQYKTTEDLLDDIRLLIDSNVRTFALGFDSDEEISPVEESGIANQKKTLAEFLSGDDKQDKFWSAKDSSGISFEIVSTIKDELAKRGLDFDSVKVVDINEPPEVRKARNEAAAKRGENERDRLDALSFRQRMLELMWGTPTDSSITIEEYAKNQKAAGITPLISEEDARKSAHSLRGELDQINVSGNGGDFSKGAGIEANSKKRKIK